jgi:hypothetical protein
MCFLRDRSEEIDTILPGEKTMSADKHRGKGLEIDASYLALASRWPRASGACPSTAPTPSS